MYVFITMCNFQFQATKPPFVEYFNANKAEFSRENPDLTPSELTKFAMGKYKQAYAAKTNGTPTTEDSSKSNGLNAKRKINTEDNERSGIAKLAKYSKT